MLLLSSLLIFELAFYLLTPADVDAVRRRWSVLAELEEHKLLLKARVWPYLLAC